MSRERPYKIDPHEVLGIRRNASTSEIREAHRALYKRYAPHLNLSVDEVLRELAEEKVKEINAARDLLLEDRKRRPDDYAASSWAESGRTAVVQVDEGLASSARVTPARSGARTAPWALLVGTSFAALIGTFATLLWLDGGGLRAGPEPTAASSRVDSLPPVQQTATTPSTYERSPRIDWSSAVIYASGAAGRNVVLPMDQLWVLGGDGGGQDRMAGRLGLPAAHVMISLDASPSGELWGLSGIRNGCCSYALWKVDRESGAATGGILLSHIGGSVTYAPVMAFDASGGLYLAGRTGDEGKLVALDVSGDPPQVLTSRSLGFGPANQPFRGMEFSPDGTLYTVIDVGDAEALAKIDVGAGTVRPVAERPIYGGTVRGLFFVGTSLLAVADGSRGSHVILVDRNRGTGALLRELSFDVTGIGAVPRSPAATMR